MDWLLTHRLPLVFLLAYTAAILYHAWTGHRDTRSVADYYVGGRRLSGWSLGLSYFATYASTNSFIGLAGQSYTLGVSWLLLAVFLVLFSLLSWAFVAPRLRVFTEHLGSLTVSDFLGFRFQSTAVRCSAAVIIVFASLFYMTAIFKGAGEVLAAFLHLPYEACLVVIFLVVVAYTCAGGFISVVRTDVLQGLLMIGASVLLFFAAWSRTGGFAGVARALSAPRLTLPDGRPLAEGLLTFEGTAPPLVLFGLIIAGSIKMLVEPRQISRFYALAHASGARHGLVAATLALGISYFCLLPLGLLGRAVYPAGIDDTDRVVPRLLTEANLVGPVVAAFLLVVLMAAAMSSLDSVLLVVASSWQRDLVEVLRPSRDEAQMLARTRFYVVVLAALTLLIALRPPGGIVPLTVFSGSLFAACFLPALLFGLFWRGGSARAVLFSFALGFITLLAWPPLARAFSPLAAVHEVFPAVLASTLAFLAVSRLTAPLPASALAFFPEEQ
jgi:SSS family transporter